MRFCLHCGTTVEEFRAKRTLGCARCYADLGPDLWPHLLFLHPDLATSAWKAPLGEAPQAEGKDDDLELIAKWREQLAEALRHERYEEAARLQKLLDKARHLGRGEKA